MKLNILLVAVAALTLGSCSTAYRSGQTPDDVYFSPGQDRDEYVQVAQRDDREYRGSRDDYYEDRYLRMRMMNRNRWGVLDDYYFHNTFAYNYYGGMFYNHWNNPWNSYWGWNSFYNPYAHNFYNPWYHPGGVVVINPISRVAPSRPVVFNTGNYGGAGLNRSNSKSFSRSYFSNGSNAQGNSPRYNNRNSYNGGSLGGSRGSSSYGRSNNSNNGGYSPSNSTPSRSYNPSSSSSSGRSSGSSSGGSSSGGSSGGGRSRPGR